MSRDTAIEAGVPSLRVLNALWNLWGLKTDKALALRLGMHKESISPMRCSTRGISNEMLVKILRATDVSVRVIDDVAAGKVARIHQTATLTVHAPQVTGVFRHGELVTAEHEVDTKPRKQDASGARRTPTIATRAALT